MSDANNEQLRPPPSWDKFEEICADLFSRIWKDSQLVRYGRQGQRQHGVDIYGKEDGTDSGVQCKGKRNWPPTKLTTAQIDSEVAEAKKFDPALKTYIIVTTAENDVHLTDHVNAISTEHAKQGLFRVTVFGWSELARRLNDYPDLLKKHFSSYTLRRMEQTMPDAVADRVVERLQSTKVSISANEPEQAPHAQPVLLNDKLADALERDLVNRYERALQRSIFPELIKIDEFAPLAVEILDPTGTTVSPGLRRTVLFRAARSAAINGHLEEARRFLSAGQALSGSASDAPARARIAVAEHRANDAIQILRDIPDADARSVLLSILAVERSDDEALEWFTVNNLSPVLLTGLGVLGLCHIYLRRTDFEAVNRILAQTTVDQFAQAPYLYFLR